MQPLVYQHNSDWQIQRMAETSSLPLLLRKKIALVPVALERLIRVHLPPIYTPDWGLAPEENFKTLMLSRQLDIEGLHSYRLKIHWRPLSLVAQCLFCEYLDDWEFRTWLPLQPCHCRQ